MTAQKKKRGLGRGLDALFQDSEAAHEVVTRRAAEEGATATAPQLMPVGDLKPGKFQPRRRFVAEAIEQLADSIATHGVLQPLLVRPLKGEDGMHEIIAGERRWRAAQKAKVHEVPVIILKLTDDAALEIALIENLQRQDLTALEEAEGYVRLIEEFGHTQDVLAKQLGKSRSHIANMMRLLKLPNGVQDMLQDEKISAGHARALLSAKDPETLAAEIVKKGWSVRETERRVAAESAPSKTNAASAQPKPAKDVNTLALEEELSNRLGLKVEIEAGADGESGRLVVSYKTLDQLDTVIKTITS